MIVWQLIVNCANHAETKTPLSSGALHLLPRNGFIPYCIQGIEMRLVIASEDVGLVLGSRGNTLRMICHNTRTWSKFFKSDYKSGGMPSISIRGFVETDVREAVRRLTRIAKESADRRARVEQEHTEALENADIECEGELFLLEHAISKDYTNEEIVVEDCAYISAPAY